MLDASNENVAVRVDPEAYRTLFQTIDDGFTIVECILDASGAVVDWTWLEVNPAFYIQSGMQDVVGKRASEVLDGALTAFTDSLTQAITTGQIVRAEADHSPDLGRWFRAHYAQVGGPGSRIAAVRFEDVTERKQAEEALRESEERQAILLRLTDALRPLTDPQAITAQATRILGDHLRADRTFIAEIEPDGVNLQVHDMHLRSGAPSLVGLHNFDLFGTFVSHALVGGEILAVDDIATLTELTAAERAHYDATGIAAYLLVPLVRNGRLAACLAVNHRTARSWTEADRNIAWQTADRTWTAVERARAEALLRESEERFRQFAASSADALWIRNATTHAMEYVSPAISAIYGVEIDAFLGDMKRWAALIVPEDRDMAFRHIEAARDGETVIHEFRIQRPSDGLFRWIRNTDFPLRDEHGRVQRIGGIAADVTEEKLSAEHQSVLLHELQHRVRNIMALIRSITARTGERAESVPEYAALMAGRLMTFSRVQALLTRGANVAVGIRTVVGDELGAQAQHDGQFELVGPDVALSPKAAEVLTLAVHELTTNAVKYGALSVPDGVVAVRWQVEERRGNPWLSFDWTETGAPAREAPGPAAPRQRGFGSELIEGRIPYELKGRGRVTIEPGGARCHLEFPLMDGASILETDAPRRATVFGGAIDMTGEADLGGHRILVVEDDYYLATDTARAVQGTGAEVLGPCATEEEAREEMAGATPTGAVIDINLGGGPSFGLAATLKQRGIPFVIITGYDEEVIPPEFDDVPRLQKPIELRKVVGTLAATLKPAA